MKNKKLSWVLLPVVLGIWGAIGWQVYAAMKSDDTSVFNDTAVPTTSGVAAVVPDTFTLLLDYRDPFLDKPTRKPSVVSANNANHITAEKTTAIPNTVTWPAISYSGLVRQPNGDRMVGFLSINGQTHFVKSGDVIDRISVGRIARDSVEIIFGKERRYFRK